MAVGAWWIRLVPDRWVRRRGRCQNGHCRRAGALRGRCLKWAVHEPTCARTGWCDKGRAGRRKAGVRAAGA